MTDFVIATDTSANLPTTLVQRYQLPLVALSYNVEHEERQCLDIDAFDGGEFYARLKHAQHIGTSLVNAGQYIAAWEPIVQSGRDLLFIGMSSGISGSYHSATLAAAQLRETYPQRRIVTFDTLAASLGEGLQVLLAAQLREQGQDIEQIMPQLEHYRQHTRQVFTVDDLMFLRRGGRVSSVTAAIGSLLSIKPILWGDEEGRIIVHDKVRGRKSSIRYLAESMFEEAPPDSRGPIGIAHAGCPEDAQRLIDQLRGRYPQLDIINVCYEPVTGSHVGPGALALFYQTR